MKANKTITNKVLGSKKHPNMFVDEMSMNYLEQIQRYQRDSAPTEKKKKKPSTGKEDPRLLSRIQ